jgi:hypothetical protein
MNDLGNKIDYVIPLASVPDEPNVNGITYVKDSIDLALDNEKFKRRLENKLIIIIPSHIHDNKINGYTFKETLYVDYAMGYVNSIDINNHNAFITIFEDRFKQFYLDKSLDDFCLGMAYEGVVTNNTVTDINIKYYMLIEKEEIENVVM